MSITTPVFYPQPWAANEQLVPLTPEEMAAGYPSGTDEKPSRQSINNALQYAVNGVLYYLTTGIPAWTATAVYQAGAIVMHGGRYYASLSNDSVNQLPGSAAWVELLWLQSVLDARYAVMGGNASFATCNVANSPVRTFDNTPDVGGGGGGASTGTAGQLQMVGATPGSFAASALSDVSGAIHSSEPISVDSDQATLFLNSGASSSGIAQVQFQATGTSRYGLILWGQGNGAGLFNVLGLYDGTRGAMIWNTNDVGDMFFNTPLTNVSTGVGAAASIDHLGNAAFANLSSNGSSVRTLANTPDSGGGHPSQGPGNSQSGSLQFGTGDGNFAASYCGYNLGTGDMTQPGQLVCNYLTLTAAATSSAPVAGTAPALPAAPLGYWSMRLNGTQVVIPFYAAGAEARPS